MRPRAGHPSRIRAVGMQRGVTRFHPGVARVLDSSGRGDRTKHPASRQRHERHERSTTACHAPAPCSASSPHPPPPSPSPPARRAPRLRAGAASGDEYGLVKAGTLTVATEGTYRPFSYHEDGTGDLDRLRRRGRRGGRRQARPRDRVPGDAVGCDLRGPRRRPVRRDREPGVDQPRARGAVPLQRALHRLAGRDRRQGGRQLDLELRRPGRQDHRAVAHEQLVRARQESGANVEAVEGWAQAVALLEQGRVDATINDKLTYLDYVKTNGQSGIKVAAETDDPSLSALAFTKDKADLVAAIDARARGAPRGGRARRAQRQVLRRRRLGGR